MDFLLCDAVVVIARVDFGRGGGLGLDEVALCHAVNFGGFLDALVDPGRECCPVAAK